jgi:hypothetical protein
LPVLVRMLFSEYIVLRVLFVLLDVAVVVIGIYSAFYKDDHCADIARERRLLRLFRVREGVLTPEGGNEGGGVGRGIDSPPPPLRAKHLAVCFACVRIVCGAQYVCSVCVCSVYPN